MWTDGKAKKCPQTSFTHAGWARGNKPLKLELHRNHLPRFWFWWGGRRREAPETKPSTHHDAIVDEAAAVASRFQVWIFLRACHPDGPNLLPSLVQLHVDRVHTRVVGGHSVPHVSGDAMLLQRRECGIGVEE